MTSPSPEELRHDIAKAARMAVVALDDLELEGRGRLAACTIATQRQLMAEAVVAYLLAHGLVSLAPPKVWERFISCKIPEPYRGDLLGRLDEGVRWLAEMNRRVADAAERP